MIRKSTWIILIVLVVLLGATWYLEWSPAGKERARGTPTATPYPTLFEWNNVDVAAVTLNTLSGESIGFRRNLDQSWGFVGITNLSINQGTAEQIVISLQSIKVQENLGAEFNLGIVGLENPNYIFTITFNDNRVTEIRIGNATTTGTGYYIQVNDEPPVVVSKGSIDSITSIFTRDTLTLPTPTPFPTSPPVN